jgi:hypothetical protein
VTGVYSKRFIGVGGLTGSASTAVPAGKVWIVSDITVVVAATAGAPFLYIRAGGNAIIAYVTAPASGPALMSHTSGHHVMNAGEALFVGVSGGTFDVTVSGYELSA